MRSDGFETDEIRCKLLIAAVEDRYVACDDHELDRREQDDVGAQCSKSPAMPAPELPADRASGLHPERDCDFDQPLQDFAEYM